MNIGKQGRVRTGILACAAMLCGAAAVAQTESATGEAKAPPPAEVVQTFYLSSVAQVNDANEIVTGLRNILDPRDKIYLLPSENAITIRATPDQVALAQRLLKELDRPKRTYRLIYTVTEMDGGKRVGLQHFSIVLSPGARTVLKQGSRVPIATGSTEPNGLPNKTTQTQFTYLDVGLNIDASIDGYVDGVRLRTKVEQSSLAEERSAMGLQDPVIRQTMLEGTAILTQGKPIVLGSLDVPGSTRHLEVEVVLELVP